jgi:glycosyltransferase involved in cell wall biosynthesis
MVAAPLISVIVPCFNHAIFLEEALRSVYDQTYKEWECLVINDGSTDDTEKIALTWKKRDSRFKYFYKKNGGLSSARNKGLDEAKGEYIQFLDADDLITADKFSVCLQSAGDADVIVSDFRLFHKKDENSTSPPFTLEKACFNFQSILTGWDEKFVIPIHCGIFKKALFIKIRFDESLKAREDWLMWLQIYLQKVTTLFIGKPLALYRYSDDGMSQNKSLMESNLVKAYQLIYDLVPEENRAIFFKQATNNLGRLLAESNHLVAITKQSKSYRLGNFFVRKINKANKLFK